MHLITSYNSLEVFNKSDILIVDICIEKNVVLYNICEVCITVKGTYIG